MQRTGRDANKGSAVVNPNQKVKKKNKNSTRGTVKTKNDVILCDRYDSVT